MLGEALHEASLLVTLLRAREIKRTAQRTLDEIATRFPSHLIDDVNARGFPPDPILSDIVWPPVLKEPMRALKNRFFLDFAA